MSELTIHGVPAEVMQVLEADAARSSTSVDEVARRLLLRYAEQSAQPPKTQDARREMDRIRAEIQNEHGTLDVVVPLLREDRDR